MSTEMKQLIRRAVAQALVLILTSTYCFSQDATPAAQAPAAGAGKLNILIISGDGAINNIKSRTAREMIVEVRDENNKPVAGAAVVFLLPSSGPGVAAPGGSSLISSVTDQAGRAAARGLKVNPQAGRFNVQVRANFQQRSGQTVISQSTSIAAAAGISGLTIGLIAAGVVVGVVAGVVATQSGGNSSRPSVGVSPGNPSAGPPR
jgi:hypothetical protein